MRSRGGIWFEKTPILARKYYANWRCFSLAINWSKYEEQRTWTPRSVRCGVFWGKFSDEKKATIGAETCFHGLVLKKWTFAQNCPVDLDEGYLKRGNLFKSSWAARWYSWRKRGPSSVQLGNKEVPKASLILEELSLRLLLDQKDWTTKQRFSCGRYIFKLKKVYIYCYLYYR